MKHLFIPDTQCAPGTPTRHLKALGNYIVAKKPDVIVHIGDHWDFPSLSSYEKKGSRHFEGKRYVKDVDAGNKSMDALMEPINAYNRVRSQRKEKQYKPRLVFTMGNHEHRVARAVEDDPRLEGVIGFDDLNLNEHGWEVIPFQEIVEINGILYSHFFTNQASLMGRVLGGTIENKLRIVGQSFSMGHQQQLQYGILPQTCGRHLQGLVAGAFYLHDEHYMGPQQNYWRGVIMKNEVKRGNYDPCMVSAKFLLDRYG